MSAKRMEALNKAVAVCKGCHLYKCARTSSCERPRQSLSPACGPASALPYSSLHANCYFLPTRHACSPASQADAGMHARTPCDRSRPLPPSHGPRLLCRRANASTCCCCLTAVRCNLRARSNFQRTVRRRPMEMHRCSPAVGVVIARLGRPSSLTSTGRSEKKEGSLAKGNVGERDLN